MPIPDYQPVMLLLLRLASDGNEHTLREAVEELAEQFKLTEEERKELLLSGSQFIAGVKPYVLHNYPIELF